ncbi:MAG TPA: hypothetical protein VE575_08505, partial [Acidimicrobiales bacterium]|nr:hypothetical protein [Acidimicrobiales bacterium]
MVARPAHADAEWLDVNLTFGVLYVPLVLYASRRADGCPLGQRGGKAVRIRRALRFAAATMAAGALTMTAAAPAGAQEPLGFEVDRTEGVAGDVVTGQVDVADVAEHCTTDVAAFQARFDELLSGPYANGLPEGELFDRFFPTGEFDDIENHAQVAYLATGFVVLGLSFDPALAEEALPQTFVMTFADIATQEPVGELGNFDPDTGEGSVTVPDVEPGLWAVAAACVGPSLDLETLEAGIRENGEFLEGLGAPATDLLSEEFVAFMREFTGNEDADEFDLLFEFLGQVGPTLLQPIVQQDALGVQLFNVLPDPRDLIADVIADIDGLVADGELKVGQA